MQNAQNYFQDLQKIDNQELSEHSLRTALENLLNQIKAEAEFLKEVNILQEGKRIGKSGVPDFRITSSKGSVGYIETKKIGENLAEIAVSDQIQKYQELNDNILLTDYCAFWWLKGNTIVQKLDFCQPEEVGNIEAKFDSEKGRKLEILIQNFLRETPKGVNNAHDLAKALAVRTRFLKNNLQELLQSQIQNEELLPLRGLYDYFKSIVSDEFSIKNFADTFAQTFSYSLFLAKLNAENQVLTLQNVKNFIPISFGVIREIAGFLEKLESDEYRKIAWVIKEIINVVDNLDLEPIRNSLSFNKNIQVQNETAADPYLYFYEDFLGQYDPKLRKAKGVYYTPPAVVNFIVRAIDQVLQKDFQIESGLADKNKVTVLDFATGTGTFILEILKVIFEKIPQDSTYRNDIVQNHILKNLYGFEYLIAPYTVAHLKLSQFLKDNAYDFNKKDRLQIYLTNTLEPLETQPNFFLPELSKEGTKAQNLKKQPVLVICGNPPYSYHSANKNKWILDRINEYKKVGNESLDEKNSKGLQDDYVKFIRFAEWKMQQVDQGVVGIVSNHSFLDNPTFRLMRKSLMNTFGHIYLIDLHGNAKKKETTPEGQKDQNVFDIEQGVSISIFVKNPKITESKIFYADFYGTRQHKFDLCLENDLKSIDWQVLNPKMPFYLFKPQNITHEVQYNTFWSVKDIFNVQSVGVVTANDNLLMAKNFKILNKRVEKLITAEDARQIVEWFKLDNKYKPILKKFLQDFENGTKKRENVKIDAINYKPFDKRVLWYDNDLVERMRSSFVKNFEQENIGLVFVRSTSNIPYSHVLCVDKPIVGRFFTDAACVSYLSPLYVYQKKEHKLDLNQNPKYARKLKKLQKEFQIAEEVLEESKILAENIADGKQKNVFLDSLNKVFEEAKTCYEKNISNLESEYSTQKPNANGYEKTENFTPAFQKFLENYNDDASPEQVLAYIYAVLHSPNYRLQYADFLKMDFPKIPFPNSLPTFENLARLGQELIDAHLLRKIPALEVGMAIGNGTNEVSEIRYVSESEVLGKKIGKLYYNKTQYFDKVSPEIWDFQVGAYKVLEKYLKDRKGEILENEEVRHLENVIKVLAFTLEKMLEIDK
ncbi:MAG: hypothetical protein EAZ97_03810 [Bacteroidetes bacterium]|nr:MAG: hypothetical protein EAZ97_03810 [Bacteroidota bacterium]